MKTAHWITLGVAGVVIIAAILMIFAVSGAGRFAAQQQRQARLDSQAQRLVELHQLFTDSMTLFNISNKPEHMQSAIETARQVADSCDELTERYIADAGMEGTSTAIQLRTSSARLQQSLKEMLESKELLEAGQKEIKRQEALLLDSDKRLREAQQSLRATEQRARAFGLP